MKKKLLILGLIIAALALTGCERPTPPAPEEPAIEHNDPAPADFEYETNGGAITLTKYTGRDASPVIPATIEGVRVTAIGESAFAANRAVQTVVIPEGVTAIGSYAFECCTQLGEVTLPSTLRSIGEGAFNGCMLLGKADIPEGVTEIGNGAFMYCRALKSASLPSTLESVGDFMFAECDALAAVSLGEGIGKISERMFWRCKSLDNVTIPSSVSEIGATAFSRCETLSNITVPDSVKSIGKYAFYYCEALREINFPAYIVRESTFAHCFALESVTLSPDVKIIEQEAFRFTALSSTFALPDGIESIGECAFAESKLEGFELSIFNENYAVEDGVLFTRDMKTLVCYPPAKNTVSYDVPWSVETIGVHAFTGVTVTETVNLEENVTTIEPYAFSGFHSATEFVIPETVTSLGEGVFMETAPDSIELRASITELPASTFEFCSAESITLPDTLERLGEYSLAQCSSLETLTLPYSLVIIDPGALMGCSAELYSDSVAFTIIDNAVYSSDLTTLIWYGGDWEETEFTVPGGVQTIAGYAVNCANLETLYLPDSLFYIGEGGVGYSLTREYGESSVRLNTALTVIGPDSTGVTGYAAANELCYFTGEPSLSDTELTLAGDETATLTLDGVPATCVSFSCFDEVIATVDENGVITAHTSGTTEVYASVGAAYFKCEVTVTGDGTPVDTFDTSKYLELGDDDYQPWLDTYIAANGPDIIFGTQDNPFSTAYKGQFYYEAIWMAQSGEDVNSSFGAVSMYDPDYGAQFGMIIHGLATELDCYTQTDDMVLYSGVGSFDSLVGCNTINEVRQHIGETVTDPCFFSTAINPAASAHFAGELGTTLVIYADKEAIDGGYIEYTVGRGAGGEYELLLKGGVKMEVLGVGVREIMIDDGSGEPAPTLQRYLKLHMYAE